MTDDDALDQLDWTADPAAVLDPTRLGLVACIALLQTRGIDGPLAQLGKRLVIVAHDERGRLRPADLLTDQLVWLAWRNDDGSPGPMHERADHQAAVTLDLRDVAPHSLARPKGYAPYRPHGRTSHTVERILALYATMNDAHALPLGPRAVGYRLKETYPGEYTKKDFKSTRGHRASSRHGSWSGAGCPMPRR